MSTGVMTHGTIEADRRAIQGFNFCIRMVSQVHTQMCIIASLLCSSKRILKFIVLSVLIPSLRWFCHWQCTQNPSACNVGPRCRAAQKPYVVAPPYCQSRFRSDQRGGISPPLPLTVSNHTSPANKPWLASCANLAIFSPAACISRDVSRSTTNIHE
jgi:hypothetical protein